MVIGGDNPVQSVDIAGDPLSLCQFRAEDQPPAGKPVHDQGQQDDKKQDTESAGTDEGDFLVAVHQVDDSWQLEQSQQAQQSEKFEGVERTEYLGADQQGKREAREKIHSEPAFEIFPVDPEGMVFCARRQHLDQNIPAEDHGDDQVQHEKDAGLRVVQRQAQGDFHRRNEGEAGDEQVPQASPPALGGEAQF